MSNDSEFARVRRPYTRVARRWINRAGLGALGGVVAGVVGGGLTVAGGIVLLLYTGLSGAREVTGLGDAKGLGAASAADPISGEATANALLSFATIPFSLVPYGLVLGVLLGTAHGMIVTRRGFSGPVEVVAAAVGATVGWRLASGWIANVPPLEPHASVATAIVVIAGAIGAAVGAALFTALHDRPTRSDLLPSE